MPTEPLTQTILVPILVFLGGGTGASLRHLLHTFLGKNLQLSFQTPTLIINLIGCFAAGIIFTSLSGMPKLKFFLITGMLGGFTTYSLFSMDALHLFQQIGFKTSSLYIATTAIGSCLAAFIGFQASKLF